MSTLLSFSRHPTIKSHQVTDTTYNCIYTFITNLKTMQTKERNQLKEIPQKNPDKEMQGMIVVIRPRIKYSEMMMKVQLKKME